MDFVHKVYDPNSSEIARMEKVSLDEKFCLFQEHWRPKVVAELNGQEVKLVKAQGNFPWHVHENEDEMFMVWRASKNRGQCKISPRSGQLFAAAREQVDLAVVRRCRGLASPGERRCSALGGTLDLPAEAVTSDCPAALRGCAD